MEGAEAKKEEQKAQPPAEQYKSYV